MELTILYVNGGGKTAKNVNDAIYARQPGGFSRKEFGVR